MIRVCTALIAATMFALAAPGNAQTPNLDDPMYWASYYANSQAICDSATPRQRAQPNTDWSVNCRQAAEAKVHLKRIGYWCVSNAAADTGFPCTPALAKKTESTASPADSATETTCQGILRKGPAAEAAINYRVGLCVFTLDQQTEFITKQCHINRPCTVRAQVETYKGTPWIKRAISARSQ